jgi:hypothetical protein
MSELPPNPRPQITFPFRLVQFLFGDNIAVFLVNYEKGFHVMHATWTCQKQSTEVRAAGRSFEAWLKRLR